MSPSTAGVPIPESNSKARVLFDGVPYGSLRRAIRNGMTLAEGRRQNRFPLKHKVAVSSNNSCVLIFISSRVFDHPCQRRSRRTAYAD